MGESDCYIDYCSISFNSSACSSQTGVHIMDITCSLRLLLTLRWGLKIRPTDPGFLEEPNGIWPPSLLLLATPCGCCRLTSSSETSSSCMRLTEWAGLPVLFAPKTSASVLERDKDVDMIPVS